jgi:hypothetical protein
MVKTTINEPSLDMTYPTVHDCYGAIIDVGDHVYLPYRGGRDEGLVEHIVYDKSDPDANYVESAPNPPKVIFKNQIGHMVAHNPGSLHNLSKGSSEDYREAAPYSTGQDLR